MLIRFPDPEFAEAFRAYTHYLEDLAGTIGGRYGWGDSLVEGIHLAVLSHPPVYRAQRRSLSDDEMATLDRALRKSWGALRRAQRELEDPDSYDEEANAWIPIQAYYAAYHGVIAFAVASGQAPPRDHAAALKLMAKEVRRGLFPYPWSVCCHGCPQTGTVSFRGVDGVPGSVHVLSRPDPASSEDRLAMFLRTTRQKELERRFADARGKKIRAGRTRRNISRSEKEASAYAMAPTTVFDVLWRLRKKASYEDADCFVLGAGGEVDARRFGEALMIVCDATLAALEGAMAGYVGPHVIGDLAHGYAERTRSGSATALGRRVASLATLVPQPTR